MDLIVKLSQICESYRGHDQILGLIGYNCAMLSGLCEDKSVKAVRLQKIASQIVNCRTILRFLDDFTMVSYAYSYGLGTNNESLAIRACNVIGNVVSLIYYPTEHIAWLADQQIISLKSDKFWVIATWTWLISSITTLISTLITLRIQRQQRKKRLSISKTEFKSILTLMKSFNFLILAIHWLPPGFLWSSKLSKFFAGLLGSIAILCNLIKSLL